MIVFPLHCLRSSIVAPLPAWVIVKPCRWNMAAIAPAACHTVSYRLWKINQARHMKPCIHVRNDIHMWIWGDYTPANVTEVPGMPPCLNGHLHPHTGSPKSSCVNAHGCMSKYHTLPCQHTWPLTNGTHVACVKSCSGTAGMHMGVCINAIHSHVNIYDTSQVI